uniref:Uncharacterized protein n=1 Tax=Siphoviridae sp. ctK0l2 TaxID=2826243 RepID=A0A8S5NKB2_9CAUD|nr:MAG TPA: hypothetical protein [Siphoviridae sp. ctK0l2]
MLANPLSLYKSFSRALVFPCLIVLFKELDSLRIASGII